METIIATMLRDFESGKVTRRQLVQALAMIAAGSPVASAMAAATPAPSASTVPWKTVWLDHISFQCADYKRSVEFYTDLMGWKVLNDTGTQATVDMNGIGGIILRNSQRPGMQQPAPSASARRDSSGATTGASSGSSSGSGAPGQRPPVTAVIDHISWGIAPWNTETVRKALLDRGLTPREDTGNRGTMETSPFKSFHVKDPDGWDLQISNQTQQVHDLG